MTSAHRDGRRRTSSPTWWRDRLLAASALLGALCIVVTLVCAVLDLRMLIFRSGSMAPSIPTGALAFAKQTPADELAVGDVVSVRASNGARITHRVAALTTSGGVAQLTLKGDANSRPDAETYTVQAADRVVLDVPFVGYAVGRATGPIGIFVGGILVGGLLWLIVRPGKGPSGGGGAGGRRRAGVVAAIAVTASAGQAPVSTLAYFSDVGTVRSAAVETHRVASQAQPTCANVDGFLVLGNIARLTWTQVDPRYEYAWELRQTSGAVVANGVVGAGQAAGTTVTLDVSTGLIGVNGNYNVAVRARLRGAITWVAATETLTPVRRGSIILIGVSMRCGHA